MSAQVVACNVRAVLPCADITLFVSQSQLVLQNEFCSENAHCMVFHIYPSPTDTCCLAVLSHALQCTRMVTASSKVNIVSDCRGSLLTQRHPSHPPRCLATRAQARASSSSPSRAAPPPPLPQPHRYCPCLLELSESLNAQPQIG